MERNLNGEPYYLNTEERKSIINQIDNEMNQASDEALWGEASIGHHHPYREYGKCQICQSNLGDGSERSRHIQEGRSKH